MEIILIRGDDMWYRYKCYLDGKYIFNGVVQSFEKNEVSEKVQRLYGDKYEVKEIEKVE